MATQYYAYIYYVVGDTAFERAARTAANAPSGDVVSDFFPVRTKQEFLTAWNGIASQVRNNRADLIRVEVFSHASKQTDNQDGIEFSNGPGGSTLKKEEIEGLDVLPWRWDNLPSIYLHGCNSGLIGTRGWCPAQTFARRQGVRAGGQTGFAYFSSTRDSYQAITRSDTEVYLEAYRRRRNGFLGDGARMDPAWSDS
jgi:hypothetical protein